MTLSAFPSAEWKQIQRSAVSVPEMPRGWIIVCRFFIAVCIVGLSYCALKKVPMTLPSVKRVPSVDPEVRLPVRKPPARGLRFHGQF